MMNTSTDSVIEEFNSKPNRVPVLGIVLPLFIVIPIGIALGLSFHKFHKRRQKSYKKEGLSPRDRHEFKILNIFVHYSSLRIITVRII
jgi:uncharacterized membrane protein YkvI